MATFDWQKEAETQWDNNAHFWTERSKNMWENGSRKDIIPFVEKHLNKESKIFDIGCGDGYGSYKLHQLGYDVTGFDISKEMITYAKGRFPNGEVNFYQGDVMELSVGNDSCDGIMAINVLEWTSNPTKALQELSRIIKVNGYLFIGILGPTSGPRTNSYPRLLDQKATCNTMMPWEFMRLATESNWEYVDGFGVYKDGVKNTHHEGLPIKLKQALSFMWVFCLRKVRD